MMKRSRVRTFLSYSINVCLVVGLVVFTLALRRGYITSPASAGYSCADDSIRKPVRKEALSTHIILIVGSLAALVLSSLVEYSKWRCSSSSSKGEETSKLKRWMKQAAWVFLLYLLGLCVTSLMVDLGKICTGVLRPNFVAVCQPNINCNASNSGNEYHYDYVCLKASAKEEEDGRKSFPSGHAAVAAYMATFLSLYLEWDSSATPTVVFMAKPTAQLLSFSLAWAAGLSRVSDNVHHLSDVLVGFVLGAFLGFWAARMVAASGAAEDMEETIVKEVEMEEKGFRRENEGNTE